MSVLRFLARTALLGTLFVALTGCSSATSELGSKSPESASLTAEAGAYALTDAQIAAGFEAWRGSEHFAYRWATQSEVTDLPCYSARCTFIEVVADSDCPTVDYRWDNLANGKVVSSGSSSLSTVDDPNADLAPGIGFVTTTSKGITEFKLTSMVCSSATSISENAPATAEAVDPGPTLIQLPSFGGASTKQVEDWIRANGYSFHVTANTELGYNYSVSCRMSNQDSVISQNPSAGAQVEDSPNTVIWLNINC